MIPHHLASTPRLRVITRLCESKSGLMRTGPSQRNLPESEINSRVCGGKNLVFIILKLESNQSSLSPA